MNRCTAQSGSFDQIEHSQKKELASKDVVATDDIFYKIRIRRIPSTRLACPHDIQKDGLLS